MSTRASLFTHDSEWGDVHVYQEMHDGAVHVEIRTKFPDGRDSYGYLNVILPDRYWQTLVAALREDGRSALKDLPF